MKFQVTKLCTLCTYILQSLIFQINLFTNKGKFLPCRNVMFMVTRVWLSDLYSCPGTSKHILRITKFWVLFGMDACYIELILVESYIDNTDFINKFPLLRPFENFTSGDLTSRGPPVYVYLELYVYSEV